jgi:hypothetical protein
MAKPLAIAAMATLLLTGVAALLDLWPTLGGFVMALAWLSLLFVVFYTVVAIRSGWIGLIGHVGQVHHVERRRSPVFFWMLVAFYLGITTPAVFYLFGQMMAGV